MLRLEVFEDLDEKCTYAMLHDSDDWSVICNADGITFKIPIQFRANANQHRIAY